MNTNAVRTMRAIGRPRPLKTTSNAPEKRLNSPLSPQSPFDPPTTKRAITDVLNDLENLHINITGDGNYDEHTAKGIADMYNILKLRGSELDVQFKDQIDRYLVTLRNVSREDRLDMASRLRLLEIIELRAMKWKSNENIDAYYRERIAELQNLQRNITSAPIPPPIMPAMPFMQVQPQVLQSSIPPLEPGEVLRSSGKFAKPTKVAGKNYFKDEIIIRNSDSGKVMGIKGRRVHMIEELSDTIISFQRVSPGARDRLVQITGPHEEAIGHAKLLVEDTIRRNASPIREKREHPDVEDEVNDNVNFCSQNYYEDTPMDNFSYKTPLPLTHSFSMSNAAAGKYTFTITAVDSLVEISGDNGDRVHEAKLVLEEYFAGQTEYEKDQPPRISSPVSTSDMHRLSLLSKPQPQKLSDYIEEKEERPSSLFLGPLEEETKSPSIKSNSNSVSSPNNVLSPHIYPSGTHHTDEIFPQADTGNGQSMPNSIACGKISYSREFLLKCAKLKYSHVEPKDFSRISKNHPLICKEPSKLFDPEEYKEQLESQIIENSNGNEKQ